MANDKTASTTISAWVPSPTDLHHLPGVFLSLHNASGRCFTRLNSDDLELLSNWLSSNIPSLLIARDTAIGISTQLHDLDKKIHKENPLIHYSINDINVSDTVKDEGEVAVADSPP